MKVGFVVAHRGPRASSPFLPWSQFGSGRGLFSFFKGRTHSSDDTSSGPFTPTLLDEQLVFVVSSFWRSTGVEDIS